MKEIPLTQGRIALVSDADFDMLMRISKKWGCFRRVDNIYVVTSTMINGKQVRIFMHRVLMNPEKGYFVDHINGNGLDNRRENLRIATHAQNMRNSKKRKSSKWPYKGISYDNRSYHLSKKWRVRIRIDGKQIYAGRFETPEEAARKYDELARQFYGEFAKLNFPIE